MPSVIESLSSTGTVTASPTRTTAVSLTTVGSTCALSSGFCTTESWPTAVLVPSEMVYLTMPRRCWPSVNGPVRLDPHPASLDDRCTQPLAVGLDPLDDEHVAARAVVVGQDVGDDRCLAPEDGRVGRGDRWHVLGRVGQDVDADAADADRRAHLRGIRDGRGARRLPGHREHVGVEVRVDGQLARAADLLREVHLRLRVARVGTRDVVAERLQLDRLAHHGPQHVRLGPRRHGAVVVAEHAQGHGRGSRTAVPVVDLVADDLLLGPVLGTDGEGP